MADVIMSRDDVEILLTAALHQFNWSIGNQSYLLNSAQVTLYCQKWSAEVKCKHWRVSNGITIHHSMSLVINQLTGLLI